MNTMQIPQKLPQFTGETALIVVSAKEQGVLYQAADGVIEQVATVEEHPEAPSDREGFFFRSGFGKQLGSGGPDAQDDTETVREFVRSISEELNGAIKAVQPTVIYFFQPQHLKGYLENEIKNPTHIPTHVVQFGNYVHETPLEILEHIAAYHDDVIDPSDPTSVKDEPNAEEKRKILEKGRG